MSNHYHLVVETPVARLSPGMRQLNGVYTQAFNRRHGRVGHLFQGRFKAILVEKQSHLLEVLRYVVLNPVRAGLVRWPAEWRWSSFRATAGETPAPAWLETAWSLAQFGGPGQPGRARYCQFVGEGQRVPKPWTELRGQIYLGSKAFVEDARVHAARRTRAPEIPRPQREPESRPMSAVLPAVLRALGLGEDDLAGHRHRHTRQRAVLAYTLRRFAGATGPVIASVLGVTAWRACALASAGEKEWGRDPCLATSMVAALRDAENDKQQT
jgi:hypothetical protein